MSARIFTENLLQSESQERRWRDTKIEIVRVTGVQGLSAKWIHWI